MMFSKNGLFLLIAIYFIFTYPFTISTWNLNLSIGWLSIGRPWQTYLLPLWFLIIFYTYQKISAKGIVINNIFFWSHILVSIIPTLFINYPFIKTNLLLDPMAKDPIEKISRVNLHVDLYLFVQLILYAFLLPKLFRNVRR
jgi:hypothetical protein